MAGHPDPLRRPGPINTAPDWAWPDRTRRAYDVINTHVLALGHDAAGQWVAIRMSDGGSDGQLYPAKFIAAKYQLHETQCCYVCIPPFGELKIGELHAFIQACERIYDGGGRLSDRDTHIHLSSILY